MRYNGILIDCARIIEQHRYYFSLLDFMADWGMNMLVLHFSDNEGCAVRLPVFPNLASPNAFSVSTLRKMVAYASKRRIEIVPELETFGHIRYITDYPEYAHLFAAKKRYRYSFNAIDPLNPESILLIARLIKATCKIFPCKYLHIGCDEVNLKDYCRMHPGLDAKEVWSNYVNRIIGLVRGCRKKPMMWADHPVREPCIAGSLRKDVSMVYWNYFEDARDTDIIGLKRAGFKRIFVAPSLACCLHRFHTTSAALNNTKKMVRHGFKHRAAGVINTIWCPFRYLQGTAYYGIAYSAVIFRGKGKINQRRFNSEFAKKVFGTDLPPSLEMFLSSLPNLNIDASLAEEITKRNPRFNNAQNASFKRINRLGQETLAHAKQYQPNKNKDIWQAMVLAGKAAWLCSECYFLLKRKSVDADRKSAYNRLLREVRKEMSEDWDKTRHQDDPYKYRDKHGHSARQYALNIVNRLPLAKRMSGI